MLRKEYAEDSLVARVGMRIRKLRLEQGMSLRDFGKHAGVHPFHVMAIELGQLATTTKTLQAIAKALGVVPVDLLNHDDDAENDDFGYILGSMSRTAWSDPIWGRRIGSAKRERTYMAERTAVLGSRKGSLRET